MTHSRRLEVLRKIRLSLVSLRNANDALAVAVFGMMQLDGFYVEGLDTSVPPDENDRVPELNIPKTWNASNDVYAMRYKHPCSSLVFEIKMLANAERLFVHGLAIEDGMATEDATDHELELKDAEYVRGGMWEDDTAWDDMFYPNKLDDLLALFRARIVWKILPELNQG